MIIKNANIKDVKQIADIHIEYFPTSDLTPLGIRILNCFYENIVKRNTGILLIAEDEIENKIAGFSLISHNTNDMFKNTLLKSLKDYFIFIEKSNKLALFKIFSKQLKYKKLKISKNPQLVYIAVIESYAGKGIGKILIEKIEDYFRHNNINCYELDVEKENITAINIYYKLGFEKIKEYKHGNQIKYLLKKTICINQ